MTLRRFAATTAMLIFSSFIAALPSAPASAVDPNVPPYGRSDPRLRIVATDPCTPDYDPRDPVRLVELPTHIDICMLGTVRERDRRLVVLDMVSEPSSDAFYRIEWTDKGCLRQAWWPVMDPASRTLSTATYDTCSGNGRGPYADTQVAGRRLVISLDNNFVGHFSSAGALTHLAGSAYTTTLPHWALCPCDVVGQRPH